MSRPFGGRLIRCISVLAGGLALAQAYPPREWDVLAWVALAPGLVVALRSSPPAAFGWSWLGGLTFFLALLRWLNFTFSTYTAIPWPLTWGPTLLLAGYCAVWFGAVGGAAAWVRKKRGPAAAVLAVPAFWVAAEWGRGHLLSGFPWGLLGYSQYLRLPVIQIAELGGVYAVSLVVVLVNTALVGCLTLSRSKALAGVILAGLVVTGTLVFGAWRLHGLADRGEIKVAIMQPSIEQPLKWDERYTASTLQTYFALTQSIGRGRADLIVWPETATPTPLRRDPALLESLTRLSGTLGAALLVGSVDVDDSPPGRIRNTAFFLTERGIVSRYDKIHLVPFGEYVPFPGVIGFVRGWAEFISEMEPGSQTSVFPGPPAPFGVVICYEGIFPELFREFVRHGARLMVNMTNDGWFGRTSGPLQHLSMYPFRAVEHRTTVVRAANTGVSAFIAPTGRITRRLGLFERGILTERVDLGSIRTLYTRLGDWLAYLCLAASGAALCAAWRPRS